MKNKLQPFQKELLKKVEEILYIDWNPIGGDDVPKDEYDNYALQVFGMIQNKYTINIQELKMFFSDPAFSKTEKAINNSQNISDFLYKTEIEDMGLDGDIENCKKVTEKIENIANEYSFQMKLYLMQDHIEKLIRNQKDQIKNNNSNFSWLKGRCDPSLLATKSFIEDLLKIDWKKYNIDQKESFVEEMVDPIGEGGMLRVCIKHNNKTIKTYTYKKEEEDIFVEIVLAEEVIITYPGGHTHSDYYDYANGQYIPDNETISFIKEMLESELKIRYVFRGKHLVGSGVWETKNERYWMSYGAMDFLNPMYWIRKWIGLLEDEKEEIITINWKK